MTPKAPPKPLLTLAFLTATACSIHIVESLIMRLLPLPFIRLGLSNIVILYLILRRHTCQALIVNVTKSLIGGVATFSLLTPATLLSLGGGLTAIFAMWAGDRLPLGLSKYGVSIVGAVAHNLTQLLLVRYVVMPGTNVFILTPILLILALFSGIVTAWLLMLVENKLNTWDFHEKTGKSNDKEAA